MSLWRTWVAPDDGLVTFWSYRRLPDGSFKADFELQLPYEEVLDQNGNTLSEVEVDDE